MRCSPEYSLRENVADRLIDQGRNLLAVSVRRYSPDWVNLSVSIVLAFGNLALAASTDIFGPQVLKAAVLSMPVEIAVFAKVIYHQNKHYPGRNIPLSTHVLPAIGKISKQLGQSFTPKEKYDPSIW